MLSKLKILFLFCIWVLLLSGCFHDSDSGDQGNPAELDNIADQVLLYNTSLELQLPLTDSNNNPLTYSIQPVGDIDPFLLENPLVFDEQSKILTWDTTGEEIGAYTIEYTAALDTTGETIVTDDFEIIITTPGQFGQDVFDMHCASCHGLDGAGVSAPDITFVTNKEQITQAIGRVSQMQSLDGVLSQFELDSVAYYILSRLSGVDFHGLVSGECQDCHDDFETPGKPLVHVSSTNNCGACHDTAAYIPIITVDHDEVIPKLCLDCHAPARGVSIFGSSQPADHIPTGTAACDLCHFTTQWIPTFFTHEVLNISDSCATCHLFWFRLDTHIASTSLCENCHKRFDTWIMLAPSVVDHSQVTGDCIVCHDSPVSAF